MRIETVLNKMGFGSRRTVKRLLKSRQVSVNGTVIMEGKVNVDPRIQKVTVAGKTIDYHPHVYYMLNKPAGVVSAVRDEENKTVIDLIQPEDQAEGLYPIGRLDKDTEGLLLMTNNGNLGYQLLLPEKEVTKKYAVTVNDRVTEADRIAFAQGVVFHGGFRCQPAVLTIIEATDSESVVLVEIQEGKFHQVKKMFLACGKKVTYLKRVSMGPIELDEHLSPGTYRSLSIEEITQLLPYF